MTWFLIGVALCIVLEVIAECSRSRRGYYDYDVPARRGGGRDWLSTLIVGAALGVALSDDDEGE